LKSRISKNSVFQDQETFSKIDQKSSSKNSQGSAPHPLAPLPPTKVGAKCLSVVVLHNQDRALSLLGVGGYF